MKGEFIRITLAVAAAIIGFSAFGCGGIPMPENENAYTTSVEHVSRPDNMPALDIVHVKFNIEFEKKQGTYEVKKDELEQILQSCSADGSCGTLAHLYVDGEYKLVSSNCEFGELNGDVDKDYYVIAANCVVPVEGKEKGKEYKLRLVTVSPDLSEVMSDIISKMFSSGADGSSLDESISSFLEQVKQIKQLAFTSSPK
ncbi:MAG: hypothetical protein ABH871_07100, partial [Pseudomonadota bacterium]